MLVAICHPDIPSRLPQGGSCLLGHNLILPFCSERTSGYWSFLEKMRGGSWRCVYVRGGWVRGRVLRTFPSQRWILSPQSSQEPFANT